MKPTCLFLLLSGLLLSACQNNETPTYASFDDYPVYEGSDLGVTYSPQSTLFKLWAPPASEVMLRLYAAGHDGQATAEHPLERGENGTWHITLPGDLNGQYYTFQTRVNEQWGAEVPDPYAKAVGLNGMRGMILDMSSTNPMAWVQDGPPTLVQPTDIVLYELHVRDLSMHPNSGISNKGKFLGLTETGTKSPDGRSTGIDHIKELGVTHVHLLPSYDFMSIDESKLEENNYNWGYDPHNYNVPEGSYSTDPADGAVRIREFKQMVQALHQNGLRVVMDVVYNHTGATEGSNFNQLVPGYYYRQNAEGGFSDASACGNETASERPMVRKFIVESVLHWAREYHVDGFRFDLMGIHDIETMNQVSAALHAIEPTIFIYGEGWTAGQSPLPDSLKAIKANTHRLNNIAAFSDDIRDGIKGSVFVHEERGFVSGQPGLEESIKFGVVASTQHPQVDYAKVNYSKAPWAKQPHQTITYVSCHDNHTLWDRLALSNAEDSEAERTKMHKLSGAIVLTSQGVPFLHAGVEMRRTKQGEENSYKSPDSINRIDWSWKSQHADVFQYFQALIALRKNHPAFRMTSTEMIQEHLRFLDMPSPNLVGYRITGNANGDEWADILVLFNGNAEAKLVNIPDGKWRVVVNGKQVKEAGLASVQGPGTLVPGREALVLVK